jgi:flagellar hook-associated protein 2
VGTTAVNIPFTGISQYATDYQAELNRAVQVANIPVTLLQAQDTTILAKKTALGSLNAAVAGLTSSLISLGALASKQALGATSSNTAVVTATATGATQATSYTVNSVTSLASAANETAPTGYADSTSTPVSTGTITLVAGGVPTTIKLTGNNLNTLSSQINVANAGVTASVVNNGSGNVLSIVSNVGVEEIQLFDGTSATGTDLLTNTGTGTEQTTKTFADPSSTQVSKGTMTLVSGSTNYTFQLTGNNLTAVRDQINAQNAGVTASILTTSQGNFLTLAANNTGATTLKLFDGPNASGTNLLSNTNQGSNARFQLNGIDISQAGNTVNTVIPGVTLTLQGKSSTPTTISLASDPTQLSSTLQSFVTNYNAVATAVAGQEGASSGALGGDSTVNQLQTLLNQLSAHTSSTGSVQSLADLGIEFSSTGQASFNQTTFSALSQAQVADGFKFIGSATTGLAGFGQSLSAYSDPISGLIQNEESGLTQTDADLQHHISTLSTRIGTLTNSLTAQFEKADAQQAELQSQQQSLQASLQGLSLVLYGKNLQQA